MSRRVWRRCALGWAPVALAACLPQPDVWMAPGVDLVAGEITTVEGWYRFAEGPAPGPDGVLYFSDMGAAQILKRDAAGHVQVLRDAGDATNGLAVGPGGELYGCAAYEGKVVRFDAAGARTVVVPGRGGTRFNSCNDLWVDARGGIYLTDPRYSAKPKDQPGEYVYYVDPESMTPTPVLTELVRPNGIVGSADGQRLYVVDDGASTTYRYARRPDGSLAERAVAATAGADGVALDSEGRVYVVDEGLKVFDPEGKKVAEIEAPWVRTNVAFGGKDGRTLFITGKWVVYAIPWRVPGDGF